MENNRNILVLTYFSFKEGLIQAYTLPYLKIIHEISRDRRIYLCTFEKPDKVLSEIEKTKARAELLKYNIEWLPFKYIPFGLKTIFSQLLNIRKLKRIVKARNIGFAHSWGTPGGAIGYFLKRTSKLKFIIDSFEPHAEAQLENGSWNRNSLGFRVLFYLERRMARSADSLIYTTKNMVNYAKVKFQAYDKSEFIKPACVDLQHFTLNKKKSIGLLEKYQLQNKIVGLYLGKFGGIYHDIESFNFFKIAQEYWGDKYRTLVITGHSRIEIEEYCKAVGMDPKYVVSEFVDHERIPDYVGLADIAYTFVKSVPSKKCCTPIKNGEYWAMGLPIVTTKEISDDSGIIQTNDIGYVLNDLSKDEMKRALKYIDQKFIPTSTQQQNKIRRTAEEKRNFQIARDIYKKIYS